ncbi:MAG: hypothetical protein Q9203_002873 [Teloschistes exilis]
MDVPKDDFKWFGQGFDGFPKFLPDDCTEYMLYILDAKASDFQIREQLRKVQTAATALCRPLLKDFIWQRDHFNLELIQSQGELMSAIDAAALLMFKGLSFLQGRTNFGDSVDDEWLIVYLLRELSRQFPFIWIRIVDSDGEFLLVEAADALPKWLNPEVAENRVWINKGRLLIIPGQGKATAARKGSLKLDDALNFLQHRESDLLHSLSIESEAFYRLQKYPQHIQNSLHRAIVTIPRKLAHVLYGNAAYISPAVEAFYLRDPIAIRPLQAKNPSKLLFPPDDLVAVSVKFTRVGYAQLKGQDFDNPPAWVACPAGKNCSTGRTESEMMGMKVACGFEMLMSDPQNVDKQSVREIQLLLEDLDAGDDQLPSDDTISTWPQTQDNESWLDINFEDFEKELSGRRDPTQRSGFGDEEAQDNLKRMVSRFERFLNDDEGGAQDAEYLDDMDNDNESDIEDESLSLDGEYEEDEGGTDFNEKRFDSLMRDMMGLPPMTGLGKAMGSDGKIACDGASQRKDESADEETDIRKVMQDMENELRDAGALPVAASPPVKSHDKSTLSSQPTANGNAANTKLSPAGSAMMASSTKLDIDFARTRDVLAQTDVSEA